MNRREKIGVSYPDNVELATAPNPESNNRSNPGLKSLERFCRGELTKKFTVREIRPDLVVVYDKRGSVLGIHNSIIEAHREHC